MFPRLPGAQLACGTDTGGRYLNRVGGPGYGRSARRPLCEGLQVRRLSPRKRAGVSSVPPVVADAPTVSVRSTRKSTGCGAKKPGSRC